MAPAAQKVQDVQPLKIIVVGAGIAGLCTAVALRQAGHNVEIFEKSKFAAEVGAALALSPNGVLVLKSLGFDFERARARQMTCWETVHGDTLERINKTDLSNAEERFGASLYAVHRIDLHKELLRLALDDEGEGMPAILHLGSPVVKANVDEGSIELPDGSVPSADLVVGCDGLHSVLRSAALEVEGEPTSSGLSAFRFLADTAELKKDESIRKAIEEWKAPGATILADTTDTANERHAVWYDCQDGDVQNFVGIHPTRDASEVMPETQKDGMIQEFGHFHPAFVKILRMSTEVKCWPLFIHKPLPQWTYGKVLLIGDAAHPMLPFGGQGSNQAIEDGGALGFLLKGVGDPAQISDRLKTFESIRRRRASRVQTLSNARANNEKDVAVEVQKYIDGEDIKAPTNFAERVSHDYGYDVLVKCQEALAQA